MPVGSRAGCEASFMASQRMHHDNADGTGKNVIERLARISQRGGCIGVLDLRKSCCKNGLSRRQGEPDADRV
jgi:hypothetical protein